MPVRRQHNPGSETSSGVLKLFGKRTRKHFDTSSTEHNREIKGSMMKREVGFVRDLIASWRPYVRRKDRGYEENVAFSIFFFKLLPSESFARLPIRSPRK